jgi:glycosyltransferase involved in cell wall biosynthesis
MPIEPYKQQVDGCIDPLRKQTARPEVIVAVQQVERYINKNKLLNDGFKQAKGDYIMHCDADFRLTDPTLLQRMREKMDADNLEVIYPKFMSPKYRCLKIADGGPFMHRSAILKHGPLNETLMGISYTTFPFLMYAIDRLRFHCSDEFVVDVDWQACKERKRNGQTAKRLKPIYNEAVRRLKGMGAWPA